MYQPPAFREEDPARHIGVRDVAHNLNQYGPALVDRLLQDLPLDMGQHWVLTV